MRFFETGGGFPTMMRRLVLLLVDGFPFNAEDWHHDKVVIGAEFGFWSVNLGRASSNARGWSKHLTANGFIVTAAAARDQISGIFMWQ